MTIHRTRIRKLRVAALLLLITVAAALVDQVLPASSSAGRSSAERVPSGEPRPPRGDRDDRRREHDGVLGVDDGVVPDGATAFDDQLPGVARLDAGLRGALRRAALDAADDGVALLVDSGWRSPEYQEQLLREAIAKHGSEEEAARWVATPDTSAHVSGDAVDIGPSAAAAWLSEHGAEYGLCQVYANEPWHYELRAEALDRGCPPMYPDPAHDPRLHR